MSRIKTYKKEIQFFIQILALGILSLIIAATI